MDALAALSCSVGPSCVVDAGGVTLVPRLRPALFPFVIPASATRSFRRLPARDQKDEYFFRPSVVVTKARLAFVLASSALAQTTPARNASEYSGGSTPLTAADLISATSFSNCFSPAKPALANLVRVPASIVYVFLAIVFSPLSCRAAPRRPVTINLIISSQLARPCAPVRRKQSSRIVSHLDISPRYIAFPRHASPLQRGVAWRASPRPAGPVPPISSKHPYF